MLLILTVLSLNYEWVILRAQREFEKDIPMTVFNIYSLDSAPEKSKPALIRLEGAVGMIPNLAASMAESPCSSMRLSRSGPFFRTVLSVRPNEKC